MIKDPSPTIRRGYSVIVYKEGDMCVAEDESGNIIKENVTAKTVIQAANDAIATIGGKILILAGSYDISSVISLDSKVEIHGEGKSTKLTNTSTAWHNTFKAQGAEGTEKEHVILSNMEFIGDSAINQGDQIYITYGKYCTVHNCWFDECRMSGINIVNSIGCEVFSNKIYDASLGICVENLHDNIISNNYIISARASGIQLTASSKNVISNNVVKNMAYHGVYLKGDCDKTVVAGNVCYGSLYGTGFYGILDGGHSPCDNTLTGNSFCNNDEGITFEFGCCRNAMVGNVCNDNAGGGLELDSDCARNIISGNECCNNGTGSGIHIGGNCDNNVIDGNICYGNTNGVKIAGATADKNLIDSNILLNNSTANLNDLGTGTVIGDNITS